MSNLLKQVLSRLELDPPVLVYDEVAKASFPHIALLEELGVLRKAAPSASVECRDCGLDERCRVNYVTRRAGGEPEGFICCPLCGVVRVDERRLQRWECDAPMLAYILARHFGSEVGPAPIVPGRLWKIARRRIDARNREILFLPRMRVSLRDSLELPLARRRKAILLVPTEWTASRLDCFGERPIYTLEELLRLDGSELRFDREPIEEELADLLSTGETVADTPNRKRASRAAKIESLETELIEHLRAARDRVATVGDFLERPTQRELGRRCGLSESDVSRCLRDPAARQLTIYWQIAGSPADIQRWSSPRLHQGAS